LSFMSPRAPCSTLFPYTTLFRSFVNTGLLSLGNALWVVFGANVGTTMNAWLVAWLGFGFSIDTFALPFIGTGAVLMLGARGMRIDRKSTRLNSSHVKISYAVFCL